MEKKKYCFCKEWGTELEEAEPLRYQNCHDGICITGGTLVHSGFSPAGFEDGITIPEEIDGFPVTELRATYRFPRHLGFIEAVSLKRIDITVKADKALYCKMPEFCGGAQNTVEQLILRFSAERLDTDRTSFSDCSFLKEVHFYGTVTGTHDFDADYFSPGMFAECRNLKSVRGKFEDYQLCGSTFQNCTSLTEIPELRVKYFGDREFAGCSSLKNVHLHNGLLRIGSYCFQNCTSLEDLYIPDTVEKMGNHVFEGCTSLQQTHLPDRLTEICDGTYKNCSALRKIFLSDHIQTIGAEAFMACKALEKPFMPRSLKSIGARAFANCTSVRFLFLPESVEEIGEDAFAGIPGFTIKGKSGSCAERYAQINNIPFIQA